MTGHNLRVKRKSVKEFWNTSHDFSIDAVGEWEKSHNQTVERSQKYAKPPRCECGQFCIKSGLLQNAVLFVSCWVILAHNSCQNKFEEKNKMRCPVQQKLDQNGRWLESLTQLVKEKHFFFSFKYLRNCLSISLKTHTHTQTPENRFFVLLLREHLALHTHTHTPGYVFWLAVFAHTLRC